MSSNFDCSCPCPDPTVTEIPGSPGENGADGAPGADGINAFTVTTQDFTLPATAGPVLSAVAVGVSSWAGLNQTIFISDGSFQGHFTVTTIPNSTSFTLNWLDYPGDSAGNSTISSGATVSPSGVLAQLVGPIPSDMTDNSGGTAGTSIAAGVGIHTVTIPLTSLATGLGTSAIDILTEYTPGYKFKLLSFDFVTTIAGAGAGASQTFNLEIATTNVNGGLLNVTLASTNTIGKVTNGAVIISDNEGTAADSLSIEMSAGGTVFTAGSGYFVLKIQNLDDANAFASIADYLNDILAALGELA